MEFRSFRVRSQELQVSVSLDFWAFTTDTLTLICGVIIIPCLDDDDASRMATSMLFFVCLMMFNCNFTVPHSRVFIFLSGGALFGPPLFAIGVCYQNNRPCSISSPAPTRHFSDMDCTWARSLESTATHGNARQRTCAVQNGRRT
jgi:hypothetical protein